MDDNNIYRTLFFEETDDHLQQLNDNVLELENNPNDTSLLNEIFRSAHTLKGMAATMGYDVMTELTHKMENIFEKFKEGTVEVTSSSISLIFRCLDKLSSLVEDLREEKELTHASIESLLAELNEVEVGQETTEAVEVPEVTTTGELIVGFKQLEESDLHVIKNAIAGDYYAYSIAIRLEADSLLKGPRAFLIMEKLEQEGDILHTEPTAEVLEEGNFDSDFHIAYLTKNEQERVLENLLGNSEVEEIKVELFDEEAHIVSEDTLVELADEAVVASDEVVTEKVEKAVTTSEAQQKPAQQHHANNNNQSIRVDLSRLDLFLNLVSELVVYRNQLEEVSSRANIADIKESLEQVSRLTSELQDLVLKIRMQQVKVVFSRFPRMVRDLSNELGKEMDLIITGEETELDKTVVSELSEPLVHLLRNSVDHGIESPETREQLGKNRKGTIQLSAFQEGNQVMITIEDDGKGLDPEVIRASAERKGIATDGLTEEEIQHLIFHPGFSTAKEVTNISGRGVGMDVVQAKISSLGGTIELRSQVNVGTIFIIKLPLTLSIIEALMVRIGNESFAIPLDIVERVVMIREDEIEETLHEEVYEFQGEMIPIIRTNELLQVETKHTGKHYAIIVNIDQRYYGVLSDELIGQQEIVIKKIDNILQQTRKYQGATILGDGSIALILDINAICHDQRS
ncbi:chemotaxis protein CheA [Enterococcus saccharolyticus]|uniref:chemotaxis protein CheW n=1 Tax=Enterococcus saccharolyticus TaxID=41997 RepID=UPI001E4D4D77|nr:chemotaxis protein CheA [Enterococcus saccharolyticus]MCD5002861.1 chemotaxis protein CheA [Enterococcus saccharolyticus]